MSENRTHDLVLQGKSSDSSVANVLAMSISCNAPYLLHTPHEWDCSNYNIRVDPCCCSMLELLDDWLTNLLDDWLADSH